MIKRPMPERVLEDGKYASPRSSEVIAGGLRTVTGLSDFVPKGLNDRSQAIYCLEQIQSRIRPVGTV